MNKSGGEAMEARKLGRASLGCSVAGLITGIIIIIIVIVLQFVAADVSSLTHLFLSV